MDFKYKNIFKYQGKTINGTSYYNEKNEKATKRKRRRGRECETSRREKDSKTTQEPTENKPTTDPTAENVGEETEKVVEDKENKEIPESDHENGNKTKVDVSTTFTDASVSTVS